MWSYDFFNFWGGHTLNKSGSNFVLSKSLKMNTFSKEVIRESTWMLPLELSYIDDGNNMIIISKGVIVWRFKTKVTEAQEGPPTLWKKRVFCNRPCNSIFELQRTFAIHYIYGVTHYNSIKTIHFNYYATPL